MSRWLWALLGGVVLIAIAAVFWTASNQTHVTPAVSPTPVAPAPAPAPYRAERRACASAFAPRLRLHLRPTAPNRTPPRPFPLRLRRPLPLLLRRPTPDGERPRPLLPHRPPRHPRLRLSPRSSLRRRLLPLARPEPPLPPPAPGRQSAGSRGLICAQEPHAAGRDLGLFPGRLRPAFPAARAAAGPLIEPVGRGAQAAIVEVAEEDRSALRHLPNSQRIWSGRRASR